MKTVTKEIWMMAQKEERSFHTATMLEGLEVYGFSYRNNLFRYLNVNYQDMKGTSVLEIGPADFPAIFFCEGLGPSYVIEPMNGPILQELATTMPFTIIKQPAEEADYPKVDETWLFNVLTHVMNPDVIIDKARVCSNIIRFFEPINTAISIDHPWAFDMDYYVNKFGNCVQYYPPDEHIQGFHAHECAYGVWRRGDV